MLALSILPDVDAEDTPQLSASEGKMIVAALQRIAAGKTGFDEIEPMRELPGCYRWKPSSGRRYACDQEIRVVFTMDDKVLTVIAAGSRHNVYRKAKLRYQEVIYT